MIATNCKSQVLFNFEIGPDEQGYQKIYLLIVVCLPQIWPRPHNLDIVLRKPHISDKNRPSLHTKPINSLIHPRSIVKKKKKEHAVSAVSEFVWTGP